MIKVVSKLFSAKACFSGLQNVVTSCVVTWPFLGTCVRTALDISSSSCKDMGPTGLGPYRYDIV